MRNRKILILMISLVCLLVVGVGFAALTRSLSVSGTIIITPKFDVRFVEGEGYTVSTTVNEDDTVTIAEVSLEPGKVKQVSMNVKNNSTDYIAKIYLDDVLSDVTSTTGGNVEDVMLGFGSIYEKYEGDRTYITIEPGATSEIRAVFYLFKAQLETEIFTFNITFTANALIA